MARVPITLAQKSTPSRYGVEGNARLINCYAEPLGAEGKSSFALYPVDGLQAWAVVADTSVVRALLPLEQDNRLYGVSDRVVFSADASGTVTPIGGIIADGFVTMARNRRSNEPQIAITADGSNFLVQSQAVTAIADGDLKPANSVTEIDNYFIWTIPDGRMFSSALGDGTAIDPLDVAEAESRADGLVRGFTHNRDFIAFGTASTEFWQNTGEETFPLTRVTSNEVGLLSGASVASLEQTVIFVAHDGTVRRLNGYQAQRISEHWVERLIADDPDPKNISAIAWNDRGHSFYALSGTGFTAVFDALTGLWAERKSYGRERWKVAAYATFNGRHVFGSNADGSLYHSSPDLTDEAGDVLICEVQCPITHASPDRLMWSALYVDVVPSTLLTGAPNDTPALMMDYSEDGGRTFSGQRIVPATAIGERLGRVAPFRRLGVSPPGGRTIRLSWDAKYVRGLIAVNADVEKIRA